MCVRKRKRERERVRGQGRGRGREGANGERNKVRKLCVCM